MCFLAYKHMGCDTMHFSGVNNILGNLQPQSSGYQTTKLHDVISQKTIILLLTAMVTENFTCFMQGLYNAKDCILFHRVYNTELILTALVDWKEEAIAHNLLEINQFIYRHLISSMYN